MGGYLLRAPLLAVIFAAVWRLAAVFFPMSEAYSAVYLAFSMPKLGYAYMIALGLWLAVIAALVAGGGRPGLRNTLVLFAVLLLTQGAAPMLNSVLNGEATGTMTRSDLLFDLAGFAAAMLFMMVMALLLFRPQQNLPANKYSIKKLELAVKMIVLPLVYCILYFVSWYFLLWRNSAARVYYGGQEDPTTFAAAIVNMLLNDVKQVPAALLTGLVFGLGLLALLFALPGKRVIYIAAGVMLLAGPAVRMLVPSPVMPEDVRYARMFEQLALAVTFGTLAAFLLHMSVKKAEAVPAVPAKPAAAKPPAPAPAAAGASAAGK